MERILLIEDEKHLQSLYRQDLEADGYEVTVAGNAAAGLASLASARPSLVILDIRLPGTDGLHAMGEILAIDPTIPVVLNTAYSSYLDEFSSWSAAAYVIKSSDTRELRAKVAESLRRYERRTTLPVRREPAPAA